MEKEPFPASFEGFVNIGPGLSLKGEIEGSEDLVIEGVVEGKISLMDHSLHLGPKSRITAEICARFVTVEGFARGDIHASERLAIRRGGKLDGNIVAARLVLEDGAWFKGTVDVGDIEPGQ